MRAKSQTRAEAGLVEGGAATRGECGLLSRRVCVALGIGVGIGTPRVMAFHHSGMGSFLSPQQRSNTPPARRSARRHNTSETLIELGESPTSPRGDGAAVVTQADLRRLMSLVDTLTAERNERGALTAVDVLRTDVERRERAVSEREERLWGWRLIAVARDEELTREAAALEARERAVRERELAATDREAQLAERELVVEQRAMMLQEQFDEQVNAVRAELARIRNRTVVNPGK